MAAQVGEGLLVDSDDEDEAPLAMRPRQQPSPAAASTPAAGNEDESAATTETKSYTLQEQVQRLQDRVDDLRVELQTERVVSEQKDAIIRELRADVARLRSAKSTQSEDTADLVKALERERETNEQLERQLQDVLAMWEREAAQIAGGQDEVKDLKEQLEAAKVQLSEEQERNTKAELRIRAEIEQVMALWEEAQHNSALEVQGLHNSLLKAKIELAQEQQRRKQLEGQAESVL